jgi:regulator of sigma E protease
MWLALALLLVLSFVPGLARAAIARACGMRVARLMLGFGPVLVARAVGRTRLQLHLFPVGTYAQIPGLHPVDEAGARDAADAFAARPRPAQLLVLVAGALGLLAFACVVSITANLALGVIDSDASRVVVDDVVAGKPAATAGVQADDEILAVDDVRVDSRATVVAHIADSHGPVKLHVRRNGVEQTIVVTPAVIDGSARIGVTLADGIRVRRRDALGAIADGASWPFRYLRYVAGELARESAHPTTTTLSGPVGVVPIADKAAAGGARTALALLAMFATYFALWLLVFPVPPTDSGRVVAWIFARPRRSAVAAVDAGSVAAPRIPANASFVLLLVLVGLCGLISVAPHAIAIGLPASVALVGLLYRRAWACRFVATGASLLATSTLFSIVWRRQPLELLALALFAAIALLARSRAVRMRVGLECPVCTHVSGEPVLGARRAFACRDCGSTWRAA